MQEEGTPITIHGLVWPEESVLKDVTLTMWAKLVSLHVRAEDTLTILQDIAKQDVQEYGLPIQVWIDVYKHVRVRTQATTRYTQTSHQETSAWQSATKAAQHLSETQPHENVSTSVQPTNNSSPTPSPCLAFTTVPSIPMLTTIRQLRPTKPAKLSVPALTLLITLRDTVFVSWDVLRIPFCLEILLLERDCVSVCARRICLEIRILLMEGFVEIPVPLGGLRRMIRWEGVSKGVIQQHMVTP